MKRLFGTPKRTIISVICIVVVIAAVGVIAVKSTLITKAEAKAVALRDAGLGEEDASALRARLSFDDGRFQYEVDFYNNGITYEYCIQAKDGDIISRDIEGGTYGNDYGQELAVNAGNQPAADENSTVQPQKDTESRPAIDGNLSEQSREDAGNQPVIDGSLSEEPQKDAESPTAIDGNLPAQPQEDAGNQPAASGNSAAQSQGVTLDGAKAAALMDAGLSESDVTFKKAKLDRDKGIQVYDIEFYTADTEYEYEISASDSTVLEKSIKSFHTQADSAVNSSGNNYVGVDRAKEIALNHANVNEKDIVFAKAKLENDDGRVEYEIEFYIGRTEYEYEIDAVSGDIIKYDVDYD